MSISERVELVYIRNGRYGIEIDGQLVSEFPNFDECMDAYEELMKQGDIL